MTARVHRRSRPATYNAATRIARIVYGLGQRPHGWGFEAIQDELSISERTLLRYVAACRKELTTPDGAPLLEVVRRGDRRTLRLAEAARTAGSTAYQALAFYLAMSVLQFLDGTILKDGVDDLWEAFHRTLPPAQQARLAHLGRKFFTVPYAMKDYREFDDILDRVVRALVDQHTLHIAYAGLWRPGDEVTAHDFDPYTLAMYRGGLYLIGRSHSYRKIVYLAVERIRSVADPHARGEGAPAIAPAAPDAAVRRAERWDDAPDHDGARDQGACELGAEHGAARAGRVAGGPAGRSGDAPAGRRRPLRRARPSRSSGATRLRRSASVDADVRDARALLATLG
jgi:predicted DNA-binding transcriptional regulator YafY